MTQQKRTEYQQKLLDPRWQKLRLEIFKRDEWQCQVCFDKDSTLHVHHRWYVRGQEPWESPPAQLVTLCENCHENESNSRRENEALLCESLKRFYYSHDLYQIEKVFLTMPLVHIGEVQLSAIAWYLSQPENVNRIMDEFMVAQCTQPRGWGVDEHTVEAANRFKTNE